MYFNTIKNYTTELKTSNTPEIFDRSNSNVLLIKGEKRGVSLKE